MNSDLDDRIATYLRLLQQANLRRGEDLLRSQPSELHARLDAANLEAAIVPHLPGEDLLVHLIDIAGPKGSREITVGDLREAAERTREAIGTPRPDPEDFGVSGSSHGVASTASGDTEALRSGRFAEEAGLPGREDFEPRRRKDDKDL